MDAPIQQPDTTTIIDAPLQPVTVTFTRDGAPVTDTRVYFQNADSTVANTLMTDATGTASSVVGTGGSVTLVDVSVSKSPTQLTTWVGVKPGDHLLLTNNAPPIATMSIKAPTNPAVDNLAASYSLYGSCQAGAPNPVSVGVATGSGTTDVTFTSVGFDGCATTDLMVVANDIDGEPVSYFYLPAQTVADGTTLDLTLAAQTYVAPTAHSYNITGFTGQGTMQILDQQASTHGLIYAHYAYQTGDPIVATVNLPAVTGGKRIIELDDNSTTAMTGRHYIEWGGTLDPYMTDYSSHLLPGFTSTPAIDPATHILSWTQSGGAVQPDFSVALFFVNGSTSSWQWNVVGPGPSATIQLPTVPTDLADFNVGATDGVFVNSLVTAKVPGGYDAGRQVVFTTTGPHDFVTGSSGSVVANELLQALVARPGPTWAGPRVQRPRPRALTHRTR